MIDIVRVECFCALPETLAYSSSIDNQWSELDFYMGIENQYMKENIVIAITNEITAGEGAMTRELFLQAIVKFISGVGLVGLLIFLPAGTAAFWKGWLLMGILFVPMFFAGIIMMLKNPKLLKKRLKAKEQQAEQNFVIKLSGLMFVLGFILAGLNFRFLWIVLPDWISWVAAAVFLLAYLLYAEVLRENTYLSRTVEVQQGQKVIDTGLYGIVRHPMYSATIFLFLSMPLILGSAFSFVIFLVYPVLIAKRIRNEEKVLEDGLEGYKAYKKRVKYRLLPFVW